MLNLGWIKINVKLRIYKIYMLNLGYIKYKC
jgi:hypothetical protein